MKNYHHFLDLIVKDKSKMIDLLIKWASINSGSMNKEGLIYMAKDLAKEFSNLPGKLEILDLEGGNYPAIHITCRPEAPIQILFNGHFDTVYGKDHTFQHCILLNDNILKGPGVADMKGGLVIMLEVLKILEQTPWVKNLGWEVLLVPDEEIGSIYSSSLLERAAKKKALGLIFEPSLPDGSLVRARKGTALFTAIAYGKSGHIGRNFNYEDNAIIGLSNFILGVNEFNKTMPGCIFNVGSIMGGDADNVIPNFASAKIAVRYSTPEDKEAIKLRFQELMNDINHSQKVQIEVESHFMRPPKLPSELSDALFKQFEICGRELGMKLGWKDSGGASDGNNLAAAGLVNIDNLGVEGDNIHSEEEYVVLDSLIRRAQLTVLFLMKVAAGEITPPFYEYPNCRSVF